MAGMRGGSFGFSLPQDNRGEFASATISQHAYPGEPRLRFPCWYGRIPIRAEGLIHLVSINLAEIYLGMGEFTCRRFGPVINADFIGFPDWRLSGETDTDRSMEAA